MRSVLPVSRREGHFRRRCEKGPRLGELVIIIIGESAELTRSACCQGETEKIPFSKDERIE